MRVVFTRLAMQELDDAVKKYEMEFSGLGNRFRNEIKKATHRIATHPKAWSAGNADLRKCILHTFPYNLLYSIEQDHILVIAVAHQHRRPEYWIDRNNS
jgi:plasmid stabilization system protein ParE